mgnify:CR=1 FL=1
MIEESRLTMVTPEGELWQAAFLFTRETCKACFS